MIKNYTSRVPVNQTVNEIHKLLARKGVHSIMNEYDADGKIQSISFRIKLDDKFLAFKLPAKVRSAYKVIYKDKRTGDTKARLEQAERVTWRIIKDWIDAQIALVELDCAEIQEVFLPYMLIGDNTTVYESLVDNNMKLIGG